MNGLIKKHNLIYLARFYVDTGNNLLGTNGTNDKYSRLFTLWASLSATTQQAGSVDFTKSTALSSACGKVLQLRTCCLVSSANSTPAKSRGLFGIIQL
jgi:hypothetical protein